MTIKSIHDWMRTQLVWYSYVFKIRFAQVRFIIQEMFDPSPKLKKNEMLSMYVNRVEKRHALRYLNLRRHYFPKFDVDKLDRELNTRILSKSERRKLEKYKAIGEHRQIIELLRDNLMKAN